MSTDLKPQKSLKHHLTEKLLKILFYSHFRLRLKILLPLQIGYCWVLTDQKPQQSLQNIKNKLFPLQMGNCRLDSNGKCRKSFFVRRSPRSLRNGVSRSRWFLPFLSVSHIDIITLFILIAYFLYTESYTRERYNWNMWMFFLPFSQTITSLLYRNSQWWESLGMLVQSSDIGASPE